MSIKEHQIKIESVDNQPYSIFIGANLYSDLGSHFDFTKYDQVIAIADSSIADLYKLQFKDSEFINTVAFEISEKDKSIEKVQELWEIFDQVQLSRKSLVCFLGGGVLTDVGGFAAATYKRGVSVINLPTTLLAQVDASVGGKNGINFLNTKNLCGTIAQPNAVIVDVNSLKSLPDRELKSGYAEVLKHGLIIDQSYFDRVAQRMPDPLNSDQWIEIVSESVRIKAEIVSKDPYEKSLRKILNFGHTAGHAIEALSHLNENPEQVLLHGEAIAFGMLMESRISYLRGILTATELEQIENTLQYCGYQTTLGFSIDTEEFNQLLKKDKKNSGGIINWTLLAKIGQAIFDQRLDQKLVEEALASINKQ